MKDSSCCCLQLPISAVLQWLQFPVIMQLSLIANLSITDCRWEVRSESVTDGNPWCWRAGGEEEQELSQSDLQSLSIHHHLLWYSLQHRSTEFIENVSLLLSASPTGRNISRKIIMTRLCRTTICHLQSGDHPGCNILKPRLMWGAIIEKNGEKKRKI